jgi:putative tryptophan/tyrosine transport system substrate-binding protein
MLAPELGADMRRRELITLLGGAVAAWPLAARAQQPAMPVIGLLDTGSIDSNTRFVRPFRQGLGEAGYFEGQNVAIEYRWAEGRYDRLPELAADLVQRKVSVIAIPSSTPASVAAKNATTTIPIVFGVGDDPVRLGLVTSLGRPGGNATGINFLTAELGAKRLGLLHELVPTALRIAVLANPTDQVRTASNIKDVEAAARAIGLQIHVFSASTTDEVDVAFAAILRKRMHALLSIPDAYLNTRRVQLATLAARHALPTVYPLRDYVEAGGLMSYGTSLADAQRQVGIYTGRVLKGEKPAGLPVVQPTKFELVINRSTAKALDLEVPATLLASADEVIE